MNSDERTRAEKRAADSMQDDARRAAGDAGGGSGATDSATTGVGGTALPAGEVNRQRRETPGGDASKHDDNIKTD